MENDRLAGRRMAQQGLEVMCCAGEFHWSALAVIQALFDVARYLNFCIDPKDWSLCSPHCFVGLALGNDGTSYLR